MEIEFDVNRWGSCQYAGAFAFYNKFFALRRTLSFLDTVRKLGCDVKIGEVLPFETIQNNIYVPIFEMFLEEEDPEMKEVYEEMGREITKATSVDEIFKIFRDHSYDLWSAAPLIAHACFVELEIKAPKAPGIGPKYNILAQSENFETGLCCAILKEFGLVRDDECFSGFDT